MAIYDYDQNQSQVLKSIDLSISQPSKTLPKSQSKLRHLVDEGQYQTALELLKNRPHEAELLNAKAVLLLRTGKPEAAVNLLRPHVWNLNTFTLKPNVPVHVQLNFATALLMTGQVAGCVEITRSINTENEQVTSLNEAIKKWEKSLSVLSWLDWKICGIEHMKGCFPIGCNPGRFGWEPQANPSRKELEFLLDSNSNSQNLDFVSAFAVRAQMDFDRTRL